MFRIIQVTEDGVTYYEVQQRVFILLWETWCNGYGHICKYNTIDEAEQYIHKYINRPKICRIIVKIL
jgi:hypothetical protein